MTDDEQKRSRWGPIRDGLIDARLDPVEADLLAAAIEQEFPDPDAAQWDAVTLRALAAAAAAGTEAA